LLNTDAPSTRSILSYGAGVNSTALMIILLDQKRPLDEVVFADTGAERPETYQYLKTARTYLHGHNVPFQIVRSSSGSLYETCVRRRVIPSMVWRWCTRDYKIVPIYAYYRSLHAHINQYIGLAYDEIERMKDSKAAYVTNVYPLIDQQVTRAGCVHIIEQAGLPVPVKSGCYFCPFNSIEKWREIYRDQRSLYWKAAKLEETSKHFPKQRLTKLTLRELTKKFRTGRKVSETTIENPCDGFCMT